MVETDNVRDHSPLGMRGFETVRFKYKIREYGTENLPQPGRRIIFSPIHVDDVAIPATAASLVSRYDIGIGGYISALDRDPVQRFVFGGLKRMLGKGNFYPVGYNGSESAGYTSAAVGLSDFLPMADAVRKGKTMIFAAHNPTKNLELPKRGNIGSALLAHLSDAIVVPVGVMLNVPKSEKAGEVRELLKHPFRRSPVDLFYAPPLTLPYLDTLNPARLDTLARSLPNKRREILMAARPQLQEEADRIIQSVVSWLPEDRTRLWRTRHPDVT